MAMAVATPDSESGLNTFLAAVPRDAAVALRTLAHSWVAGGGTLLPGRLTVRLTVRAPDGRTCTAATLHARHHDKGPALELARVLLSNHGVPELDWVAWCDELADLQLRGLDARAKYPVVSVERMPETTVARLALAMRDLARLANGNRVG